MPTCPPPDSLNPFDGRGAALLIWKRHKPSGIALTLMPDPTYRIITTRGVIRLRSDCRRNAILSALELHGPGAMLIRVEIEEEWE
jgi:hypothetical protein